MLFNYKDSYIKGKMINSKYINIIRLLRNERRSLDELIYHQTSGLKKIVAYAYASVPFYKKLYDDSGFHPNDIQSIDDISKIPVIDKKLLVRNPYDKLISKKFNLNELLPVKTAGSNGMPFQFYIDNSFDQFRKAQCIRPYLTNGKHLFDHSVIISVHKLPSPKWFQHLKVMRESRIFAGADISFQLKTIQQLKPDIIQGYGSSLNLLAVKILDENIRAPKPRLLFADSELLMPDMRDNIEKAFRTKVIDIYGTWETDNIAYECHCHEGYHIAIDSVIMEFINGGKTVKPDEEGEIVVTVLNNYAMPFIRYNLHDMGSYNKKICSCGRTFPLMNPIKGRANDYMITNDGKKLSFFNIAYFDKLAPNVREYQIIQEDINSFTVLVVPGFSYNNHAEDVIVPAIKGFFPEAEIILNIVPSIEREPSGKFKAFKSKVNTA